MLTSARDREDVAQAFGDGGLAKVAISPSNDGPGQYDYGEQSVGAVDRALVIAYHNGIVADLPRLNVYQLQCGIGCGVEVGAVPGPLVTERGRPAGSDTEEDINPLRDGLALGLAGNGR